MLILAPPAERIVVIVVDTRRKTNTEMEPDIALLPVLGIEALLTEEQIIIHEMLVYSERLADGLVVVGQLRQKPYLRIRPVVCAWPPSEDESRLAPFIAELVEQQKREVSRA